jgi:hypothetical protein
VPSQSHPTSWGRVRSRFRLLLLFTGLVASGSTALATVPDANATDTPYSCTSCTVLNGPDNWLLDAETINYSYSEVSEVLWEKTSGGYRNILSGAVGEYQIRLCIGPEKRNEFYGHPEGSAGVAAHLAGRETNYENCKY